MGWKANLAKPVRVSPGRAEVRLPGLAGVDADLDGVVGGLPGGVDRVDVHRVDAVGDHDARCPCRPIPGKIVVRPRGQ